MQHLQCSPLGCYTVAGYKTTYEAQEGAILSEFADILKTMLTAKLLEAKTASPPSTSAVQASGASVAAGDAVTRSGANLQLDTYGPQLVGAPGIGLSGVPGVSNGCPASGADLSGNAAGGEMMPLTANGHAANLTDAAAASAVHAMEACASGSNMMHLDQQSIQQQPPEFAFQYHPGMPQIQNEPHVPFPVSYDLMTQQPQTASIRNLPQYASPRMQLLHDPQLPMETDSLMPDAVQLKQE